VHLQEGSTRTWPSLRQAAPAETHGQGAAPAAKRGRTTLTVILQGVTMRAPEGWPAPLPWAPALALRRADRAVGRGVSACRRRRGPLGPKSGRRRPALPVSHGRPAGCRRVLRRLAVSGGPARRYPGGTARSGALRAPLIRPTAEPLLQTVATEAPVNDLRDGNCASDLARLEGFEPPTGCLEAIPARAL
jgi:hypothetical protein